MREDAAQQYLSYKLIDSNQDWKSVRHGYPWVPTDQANGRPRQVGLAY
jgi:hypothetical protein